MSALARFLSISVLFGPEAVRSFLLSCKVLSRTVNPIVVAHVKSLASKGIPASLSRNIKNVQEISLVQRERGTVERSLESQRSKGV